MNGKMDSRAIPEVLLQRLSDYLTARIGLHFAKRNWKELQQKMTAAMTDFGFDQVEEFIEWLLSCQLARYSAFTFSPSSFFPSAATTRTSAPQSPPLFRVTLSMSEFQPSFKATFTLCGGSL